MNKALKILLLSDGLRILAAGLLGPIYALFVTEIGGGILEASWAVSVFAILTGITLYVLSLYEDKLKEQELALALGYFVLSLGYFGFILVNSFWNLIIIQVIIGLGTAIFVPARDGLYSRHLNAEKAASQWGAWEMMSYLVTALGAVAGGLIANYFGFKILFVIMGALSLIGSLIVLKQPRTVL